MTEEQRRSAFLAVAKWIEEDVSNEAMNIWLYSCTPYPCGLPLDSQLEDGLKVAAGELDIRALFARCEQETWEAMNSYVEENDNGS